MAIFSKNEAVQDPKNATANTHEIAEGMKDGICMTASKAGHKVHNLIGSAGEELSQTAEAVTTRIKGNPVQSTLIALGVGFIMGTLLWR